MRFCTHCGLPTARSRFPARETAVVVATIMLTVALAAYQLSSDHSAAVRTADIEAPAADVAKLDATTFDAAADARAAEAPQRPAAVAAPADEEAADPEAADGAAIDGEAADAEANDEGPANERALDEKTAGQTAADEEARPVPEPLAASPQPDPPGSSDERVPRAGVDPLLDPLDAPQSLPPAAVSPGATTKPELAEPRRARPPASIPSPPASARAPERSEAPERTTKRVVVPSTRARPDWYRELRSALAACDGDPLLARIVCQESAKLRHCTLANAWGQVAECPRARLPDATTFN